MDRTFATRLTSLVLVFVVLFGCVFSTGCSGVQKALETVAATQAEAEKLGKDLGDVEKQLGQIRQDYADAKKENNVEKMQAALIAFEKLIVLYNSKKDAFENAVNLWEKAKVQLSNAKSTEEYIGGIFGIVLSVITGGGLGFLRGRSGKAALEGSLEGAQSVIEIQRGALAKTAANVDLKLLSTTPDPKGFRELQVSSLNAEEFAALQAARGKPVS